MAISILLLLNDKICDIDSEMSDKVFTRRQNEKDFAGLFQLL